MSRTILTYEELKTITKRIDYLRARGGVLDPSNSFERHEIQAVIKELRWIGNGLNHDNKDSKPKTPYLYLVK